GDVAGSGFHGPFMNDFWVVKLNNTGAIQWKIALGGSGNDLAQSIQQTADGGYIVFGFTTSLDGNVVGNHGYFDYWMVKLDSLGTVQWQKTFGGTNQDGYNTITQQVDGAHSIQQTTDLGYIFAGYSKSNDGDVTVNHGNFDYWVVKVGFSTGINQALFENVKVYPNPSSNKVYVNAGSNINIKSLSVCNFLGQTLETTNESSIDVSQFPQGLYLIKIVTDQGTVVKKVLVK
ncbi:MAG TPA: T9SS type A sorting domain-containing protein, partial [Bacteroidia bacterium]|nr:T9SS type A sorting domain-containing protein [Bacteroidia bacterium]